MISLIARLMGLPFPLVVGLMVVRSELFRNSVRLAFRNRDLITPSGRLARRQQRVIAAQSSP
jgi:hypothetical protein